MSSNTANLQAFLIWNNIIHLFRTRAKRSFEVMKYRWAAKRQAYETMLENAPTSSSGVPPHLPNFGLGNFDFIGGAIAVIIVVVLISALIGPVANLTTGITIAHTGFTPNPNLTASPGATPLLQLYPLFFVIFGLVVIAKYATKEASGF